MPVAADDPRTRRPARRILATAMPAAPSPTISTSRSSSRRGRSTWPRARGRAGRRPRAPGHELDAGGARGGVPPRPDDRGRADLVQGPRRPADRGHALATRGGDRQARRRRVPTVVYPHGGPTWQASRAWQPFKQLLVARGLRLPRRRLPRLDRLRPGVPRGQPRRVGPCRRLRHGRRRPLGGRASRGRTAGWRSTAARTAAISSCAPRRGAVACGAPASTCTATPRSPRASATATGRAGSTCTG